MKNSYVLQNPRFVCQVVRICRAVNEHAGSRHVAACADCQAYERAAEELDSALRREATALRGAAREPSPDLARSIQRAVRESRSAPAAAPTRDWRTLPRWAPAAFAAAAALAVAFYFQRPANSSSNPTKEDAAAVLAAVENFSFKFKERVIPATGAMVASNPLQEELGSVYSDARAALNFLALNFLPSSSAASAPAPSSGGRI
jgi:hypothetical protein